MADNMENVSGITALGQRATRAMKGNMGADLRGLRTRDDRVFPVMIDNTNVAASKAKEKKELVKDIAKDIKKSRVNINYDITDDIDAIEEERRYRAAATFLEWLVNTYDGDAFSIHMLFEKHPIFLEMLQKSMRYWAESALKYNTAKLLPRTMWDSEIEDMMFMIYTMDDTEKQKYLQFVSGNPFALNQYGNDLVKRGPFNPRKVLEGYKVTKGTDESTAFIRAMGGNSLYSGVPTAAGIFSRMPSIYKEVMK